MERMIFGKMYCLDTVLQSEDQNGSRYILLGNGESDYSISFGRRRKIYVPEECYIVTYSEEDEPQLEKVEFDNKGECNYLEEMKSKGISFEIPKSLPASIDRRYSRLECAIDAVYWAKKIRGFFGTNGYAITEYGYIGDDRYESFEINFNKKPGSFIIGEHSITRITGVDIPNDSFIEKVLMEENRIEEGEPILKIVREAGMMEGMEHIRFEIEEDDK